MGTVWRACVLAIAARLGIRREDLGGVADDHEVWDKVAFYLGTFCSSLLLTCSPERIVLGGGVLNRSVLFHKIRAHFKAQLNDYMTQPQISQCLESYIVPSKFGSKAGAVGSLYLAQLALSYSH